ncbi:MAG: nickel pincer cofactor biosynthesis protein LarC [Kiritimatiellae bacterium]|nr:nickel pincer cofactor biosynthesis protein LarC [Kiritimatiellia bacterium]
MKILQFDSVGGASGDMILGALFDLGADKAGAEQALASLALEPFRIEAAPFGSHGLHGTRVTVRLLGEKRHTDEHGHEHGRRFSEIRELISRSALPETVKGNCISVFTRIAEAEAAIHAVPVDEVHFHEVGALDSIIDIVGSCLALEELGVEAVAVGPLPLGRGTVTCRHGVYPVPAPATVRLLEGFPVVQTEEPHELVTPTGAALLTTWRTLDAPPAGSRIVRAGYGFGHHTLGGRPNVLRAVLLEKGTAEEASCLVLESNIDDTVPELLGALMGRLLEAGALDAFTTAVQMKKQRPGTLLTVLCRPEQREALLDLIFRESTTFGVREYVTQRTMLERRFAEVQTPYGAVRVKIGTWRGQDVTVAPEMDDCIKRAKEKDVPVRQVYEAAAKAAGH